MMMDGMNQFANLIPQGAPAPNVGLGAPINQDNLGQQPSTAGPVADACASGNGTLLQGTQGVLHPMNNISFGGMGNNTLGNNENNAHGSMNQNSLGSASNTIALGGMNNVAQGSINNATGSMNSDALGGISGMSDLSGLLGNPNLNAGSVNSTDIKSVMNAFLMNNALQQQQPQANAGMQGMMNPLLLQSMMSQGVLGASSNPAAAPSMGLNGMPGGMNNLLSQQNNALINPATAMGMMGASGIGNLNAMGSTTGGIGLNSDANSNNDHNSSAPAVGAPSGLNVFNASAPLAKNSPLENAVDGNDLLAQQMLAQGLNPMLLLGGVGGLSGISQNQLPGMMGLGTAGATNPLGALALGMNGLGALPAGVGGQANLGADAAASLKVESAVTPHPNSLFAFNNSQLAIPQAMRAASLDMALKKGAGATAMSNAKASKKHMKKLKVKGKPKRPLSAYNFFFREERSRILDSLPKGDRRKNKRKKGNVDNDGLKEEEGKEDSEKKEPQGENGTSENGKSATKDYDQVGDDGKKIPHGKIGFENLAKLIGKRWQELDAGGLEKYKKLADQDMTRYKKEMEVFLMKEAHGSMDGELNTSAPNSGFHSAANVVDAEGMNQVPAKKAKIEQGNLGL